MSRNWNDDDYDEPPIVCPHTKTRRGDVVIETMQHNDKVRIFHLPVPVCDAAERRDQIIKWERGCLTGNECAFVPAFFEEIGKVDGVADLFSPRLYELWVTKGEVFEWGPIERQILELLHALLGVEIA